MRKKRGNYEVLSGNHRVMSSREVGIKEIPCVLIEKCDDERAARIAVNMNTVHGDPTPELLAPFLAEASDETIKQIFLDDEMIRAISEFDSTLQQRFASLSVPDSLDNESIKGATPNCVCKCGHRHVATVPKPSSSTKRPRKSTGASKESSTAGDTQPSSVKTS